MVCSPARLIAACALLALAAVAKRHGDARVSAASCDGFLSGKQPCFPVLDENLRLNLTKNQGQVLTKRSELLSVAPVDEVSTSSTSLIALVALATQGASVADTCVPLAVPTKILDLQEPPFVTTTEFFDAVSDFPDGFGEFYALVQPSGRQKVTEDPGEDGQVSCLLTAGCRRLTTDYWLLHTVN